MLSVSLFLFFWGGGGGGGGEGGWFVIFGLPVYLDGDNIPIPDAPVHLAKGALAHQGSQLHPRKGGLLF